MRQAEWPSGNGMRPSVQCDAEMLMRQAPSTISVYWTKLCEEYTQTWLEANPVIAAAMLQACATDYHSSMTLLGNEYIMEAVVDGFERLSNEIQMKDA